MLSGIFPRQAGGLLKLRYSWEIIKCFCSLTLWAFLVWRLRSWSSVSLWIFSRLNPLHMWGFPLSNTLLLASDLVIVVCDEFSAKSSWFCDSLIIWAGWLSCSAYARIFQVLWQSKAVLMDLQLLQHLSQTLLKSLQVILAPGHSFAFSSFSPSLSLFRPGRLPKWIEALPWLVFN